MKAFITACVVLSSAAFSFGQATQPVGLTQHDTAAAILAFNRRTLGDAYERVGKHDPSWDADARIFLERMAIRWTDARFNSIYRSDADTDTATMLKLAEPLLNAGCIDPLVLYCVGSIRKDNGNPDIYRTFMERAVPGLLAGNYPAARKFWATQQWLDLHPNGPAHHMAVQQRDDALMVYLLEPSNAAERRMKIDGVFDAVWKNETDDNRQALIDRLTNEAAPDKWLMDMLRGENEILTAWSARGSGFANTVTDQGWQGFRDHIAKAREALVDADQLEPTLPDAAARMITVAMAENDESVDKARFWFDRAKAAQVDFMPAWSNYAYSLQPKWGGSNHEMYMLGLEALGTGRFDTELPMYLLTTMDDIVAVREGNYDILKTPGVWKNLAAVFDGYLTPLAKGINAEWFGTRRAIYAYRCGEYAEAKKTLAGLGAQVQSGAFEGTGTDLQSMKDECDALTSDRAADVKKAMTFERVENFTKAAEVYTTIAAALPPQHPATAFVQFRQRLCEINGHLARGDKLDIPINSAADFALWRGDTDGWSAGPDGLTYAGPFSTGSRIIHPAAMPGRCRIVVEFNWSVPQPGHAPGLNVIFQDVHQGGFLGAKLYPRDNVLALGTEKWALKTVRAPAAAVDLAPDTWHTLVIDHDAKTATVTLDDAKLIGPLTNDWIAYGKPVLALHGFASSVGGSIKIRKLSIEPLP